jgi:hypothetical protein
VEGRGNVFERVEGRSISVKLEGVDRVAVQSRDMRALTFLTGSMTVEVPDTDCDSEFEFGLCKRRVPTRSRLLRSGSPQSTVRNKSF